MEELLTHVDKVIDNTSCVFEDLILGKYTTNKTIWFPELQRGGIIFDKLYYLDSAIQNRIGIGFYRWLQLNNYECKICYIEHNTATNDLSRLFVSDKIYIVYSTDYDIKNIPNDVQTTTDNWEFNISYPPPSCEIMHTFTHDKWKLKT